MAASLVAGASTGLMQPDSSATRPRRGAQRRIDLAGALARRRRLVAGREAQHGGQPLQAERCSTRRERLGEQSRHHRQPEQRRIGEHAREQPAHGAIEQRPPVGLLDVRAGVIDQMHVMHAGRTGGHAGEARQAAVDMLDHVGGRRPVLLQHVLDQIDAPARRIELVAEQHIGRAGGGAEAAMHAGAQDFFRFRDLRIGELREGEGGLHRATPPPTCGRD